MSHWLRFSDLQKRRIVANWPQLKRLQKYYGFPLGRMLSPNIRAWTTEEVDAWTDQRPVENEQPRKGAATPEGQARARATKAAKKDQLAADD